jgi:hypothetical protein
VIFRCERCGVEHDPSTFLGFLKTVAHIHYEMRESYQLTGNAEGDMRYARGVFEWFEGKWSDGYDYFDELVEGDCEKFEKYYRAYTEAQVRGPKPA